MRRTWTAILWSVMRSGGQELAKEFSSDEIKARISKAGRDAAVLVFTVVGSGYFILAPSSVEALPVGLRAYGPTVLWFNVVVGTLGLVFVGLHVVALRKRLHALSATTDATGVGDAGA